jgi:hypothetical protein
MSSVDVPDILVNEEIDSMLKNLDERLKEQRLSVRQYFTFNGTSEAEWREANRERARRRVVRTLVLQEFARREGIEVEDTEVEGEINSMIESFEGEEKDRARSVLAGDEARHDLSDRLYQRKIVERLVGIAEGTIVAAPPPAPAAAPEAEAAVDEAAEKPRGKSRAKAQAQEPAAVGEADDATQGTASDLEDAGGAAELLGTEGVDVRSENETGEARGGGTPPSAPALGATNPEA